VDGAGRTTNLDYYPSGFLKAIRDPSNRATIFDYSTALQLIAITYPDGMKTIFTYDSENKLTSAINYDGYKIVYEYSQGIARRVSRIYETHNNGAKGGELYLRYGDNSTLMFDYRARANIYQFNNYGNTVGIIDNAGRAQYYQYIRDDTNASKRNKVTLESRLQGTVLNYIKNHNAESSTNWIAYYTGTSLGSCTFAREDKYLGNQSLKIVKSNNLDRHYFSQGVTLEKGKIYTFSCFIKTIGVSNTKRRGASVYVTYEYRQGQYTTIESSYTNGTQDWKRNEVSFTLPLDSYSDMVFASVSLYDETGTAYFDCLQ
jgi:YD repeat-containing protein